MRQAKQPSCDLWNRCWKNNRKRIKMEDGCENYITFLTPPPSEKVIPFFKTSIKSSSISEKKYLESRCWNSRYFSYAGFCSNRAASSLSADSCSTFFSTFFPQVPVFLWKMGCRYPRCIRTKMPRQCGSSQHGKRIYINLSYYPKL